MAADMLAGLSAGQILLGDRAFDSNALRQTVSEQGAWANIEPAKPPERQAGV